MSHSMPKIVSPALVRNLLKQSFKLRIPGDSRDDLNSRTITLPPQADIEIEYRDFQVLLNELLDLQRRRVIQITRYPEVESGVISVEQNNVIVVEKTSSLNFSRSFKVESREDEEGHGRVRISLDWDQVEGPGDLPPGPNPFQTVLYAADGLYLWDQDANAWVSANLFQKSWQKTGVASAKRVELGLPVEFKRAIRIMRLEVSPSTKVDILDSTTRSVLFSSDTFTPISLASGSKLLPIRISNGAEIKDPTLNLYYREILSF